MGGAIDTRVSRGVRKLQIPNGISPKSFLCHVRVTMSYAFMHRLTQAFDLLSRLDARLWSKIVLTWQSRAFLSQEVLRNKQGCDVTRLLIPVEAAYLRMERPAGMYSYPASLAPPPTRISWHISICSKERSYQTSPSRVSPQVRSPAAIIPQVSIIYFSRAR